MRIAREALIATNWNYTTLSGFACLLGLLSLSGCGTTSGIVNSGGNTFVITKQQPTGFHGLGNITTEIITEATAYCASNAKDTKIISTKESQPPYILGNFPRSEVRFSCVSDTHDRGERLINKQENAFRGDDLPSLLAKLPASKPDPRVHVLAIGINDYSDVPDVPFADRSALQFAELTKKLFGAQSQNVVVLTNSEATSGRLRGRLRTLLNRLEPRDQLLIYYAGHGVPSKDGKSAYLLAQDGGPGSYQEPDLRLEQLYAAVAQSRVGKAKLFIDACFSGRSGRDTIIFEGVAPITVAPKQALPNSQSLAVLTAGRGDQFSNQDKARGHRLFGYHLMRVLLEQGGSISMETLHTSLRQKVLNDSRRIGPEFEQEPELHGNKKLSF